MNDYSFLLPQAGSSALLAQTSSALQTSGKQGDLPDFRQLMTMMMLSSLSNSLGGASGQEQGGGGMDMSSLMAPLMMGMLEKLIAAQVDDQSTGADTSIPQGQPLEGVLTQNAHAGHMALDIGVAQGTPVHATMGGKVIYAGWNDQGYGNLVIVENGPYRTYFAHLSSIPVQVGQTVRSGEVVGASGSTGNSTGPHLHYEIRLNGQQVDPASYTFHTGG